MYIQFKSITNHTLLRLWDKLQWREKLIAYININLTNTWSWLQLPTTYISSYDHDYSHPLHIYHHMIMTTVAPYIYIITWSWLQSPSTYISSHDHDYSHPLHIYYHMTYYEDYSCIWWLVDFLLWSTLLSCDHEDGNPHQLLGVCNSGRYT